MDGRPDGKTWLRVDAHLFGDDALCAAVDAADLGLTGYALWLWILCTAKQQQRFGRVVLKPRDLRADDIALGDIERLVDALAEHGLIVNRDTTGFDVAGWEDWQSTSPAERQRRYRERQRTQNRHGVTAERHGVTGSHDRVTYNRDREKRQQQTAYTRARSREAGHAAAADGIQSTDAVSDSAGLKPVTPAADTNQGTARRERATQAAQRLSLVLAADASWMADQIDRHLATTGLPADAAIAAADALARRIEGGWQPKQPSGIFGWYLKSIDGAQQPVALRDAAGDARLQRRAALDQYAAQFDDEDGD